MTHTERQKVTFEFFDNTSHQMQRNKLKQLPPLSTDIESSSSPHSPSGADLRFISSSSSINSLFDSVPLYSRTASTTTITPILSRHDSNPGFKNNYHNLLHHPTIQELDFTQTIDLKLRQHQSCTTSAQPKEKLILLLVGLPASGKSTICKQFQEFINENSEYNAQIYNAGDVRRRRSASEFNDAQFCDPNNEQGKKDRELYATITVNNLINDLQSNVIDVGFLDATNTTLERRQRMINLINEQVPNGRIVIFDVQCNNQKLLEYNISGKSENNDYKNKDYTTAINDFKQRAMNYKKIYKPITEEELASYGDKVDMYMKCVNGGQQFEFSHIHHADTWYYKILSDFKSNYKLSEVYRELLGQ
ncbi:6-phosphofructo-2-kinase [Candida albicans P75010]|nr:6-phosphofructo-2-kinase [Candida albicans P75010]